VAFWTQADIDELKAAIRSGVLTVTYAGPPATAVTYQSLAAMRELMAEMRREVEEAPTRTFARVDRGYRVPVRERRRWRDL
jgi:hypothetical protein